MSIEPVREVINGLVVPEDLPGILELRCGDYGAFYNYAPVVRSQLPRRLVEYLSSSGRTNAPEVCPQIPYGCTAWRRVGEKEWRSLDTIPKHWLPFVNRERPGPMDPRPLPRIFNPDLLPEVFDVDDRE